MESLGAFTPQVNMTEDEKSIQVSAELPGLDEKDLEISLSKDSLTIKGEKKEENELKDKESYYLERSFGTFTRVLPIPKDVNTEKARGLFQEGCAHHNPSQAREGKAGSEEDQDQGRLK